MAKFLDDLYVTGNNANVLVINSDAVADILLVSNTGAVAVGSNNFIGNIYANPKFIINTGSGIPGLMHLNSFGVELVTYTNVGDSLFGNASNHDLAFITNNIERIKVTAAGAVGINHLTPPAQLTIVGAGNTSATHALRIGNSSSNILLNVQDDGIVSVGRTLQIQRYNYSSTKAFWAEVNNIEDTEINTLNADLIFKSRYSAGNYESLRLTKEGIIKVADFNYTTLGALHPTTDKYGYLSSASNTTSGVGLKFEVCQPLNTTGFTAMQINTDGNVGINTSSPAAKLGIFNSGPATDLLIQSIATIPFVIGNFNAFSVSTAGRIVSGYLDSNLASTVGHSFYAPQGATNILTLKTQGGTQSVFEVNANGSFQIGHLASTVTAFAHNGTNTFSFTGDIVQSVGINVTAPTAILEVATGANYVFDGTVPVFKVSNNNGPYINVLNGGGIELNNYNNNLGGDNSNQDFKSFFRHYEIKSPRNGVNSGGLTYFHLTNNLSWNSAPYMRAGLNTLNTDPTTVFKIGLNRFGAIQASDTTIVELEDNFGTLSMNETTDFFKTGLKIILNDVYENTGSGNATAVGLYIDVTNSDILHAIETVNGNVVIGDLAGTGSRIVTADAAGVLAAGVDASSLVTGSGTQNVLTKWDATGAAIVDTNISDDGTNITVSTFATSGDRMVEAASTGIITATRTIINTYGVPNTEKLKLEDPLNWDVNGNYTGASTSPATDIINTYQGQKHYNDNYFYEAVADNFFIRLIRG